VAEPTEQRSNSDLLAELRQGVLDLPRQRLHVHPESAMWISISVQQTGLSPYVQVVPDPACPEIGKGWIEEQTTERWRELRSIVGQRATVRSEALGALTGVLLALDHAQARLDLGGGDVRYLRWITIDKEQP
jgi:hypothetical protein